MNDVDPNYEITAPGKLNEIPAAMPMPVSNLAAALANVMTDIEPIAKGGFNQHFRYKFTKMEDLLQEVTPKMAKHGILIMQSEVGREIKDNLLYVTFEFTLLHKSGEVWPDKPRMTGMCRIADNKGGLDDKAMNKCHTAARKYFLLALFQIPTEEDADKGDGEKREGTAERGPAPTDRRKISERAVPPRPPAAPLQIHPGETPYRLDPVHGETSHTWAAKYRNAIASAITPEQVAAWSAANTDLLQRLERETANLHYEIREAEKSKQRTLSAARHVEVKPLSSKQVNPEELRNELDRVWSEINDVAALDLSWQERVDPIQEMLFPPDLADLSKLWSEHATRIERAGQ